MKKLLIFALLVSTASYSAVFTMGDKTMAIVNESTVVLNPELPALIQQTSIKGASAIAALIAFKSIYNTARRDDFGANGKTATRLGLAGLGLSASIYCFINASKF